MANVKKCRNCQAENKADATFCFECGAALPENAEFSHRCRECGTENPEDAKYCTGCGSAVLQSSDTGNENRETSAETQNHGSRNKSRKRQQKPNSRQAGNSRKNRLSNRWNPKIAGWVALGITAFVIYAVYMNQRSLKMSAPYVEQVTANASLEKHMRDIAAKFVCACGSCPEESLEICGCPTARQERDFIRNALASGQNDADIVRVVSSKYGGLKSAKVSIDETDLSLDLSALASENNPGDKAQDDPVLENSDAPASLANRQQIIEQFSCPCGQCAIDELKDCDCDHNLGAKEVKQYIDEQIAAGKYSVTQVIERVDQTYGGRIQ